MLEEQVSLDGDPRFLTRAEAARYLAVPTTTIYHWARTGQLPCVITLGGHMRFAQADLDAMILRRDSKRRPATSPDPDVA